MRRIASHYVYWRRLYKMHYIELDDDGRFQGVYPLEQEIAETEFYDGILIPFPQHPVLPFCECVKQGADWKKEADDVAAGRKIDVYRLHGNGLSPAEFCTNNGCRNGDIERL